MNDTTVLALFGLLTERQQEFLVSHLNVQSDYAIPLKTVSRQAVFGWKRNSPDFGPVYDELKARGWKFAPLKAVVEEAEESRELPESFRLVAEAVKRNRPDAVVQFDDKAVELAEKELEAVTETPLTQGQQIDILAKFLSKVTRRHIAIILDSGTSNKDALTAIRLFYETLGITPDALIPGGKMGQTIINVLNMVAPQVAAVAQARGLILPPGVKEIVEGRYEVLDDGKPDGNPTEHAQEEHNSEVPPVLVVHSEGQNGMDDSHAIESRGDAPNLE